MNENEIQKQEMNTLSGKYFWMASIGIVICALIARITILQLLPLQSSSTFELPLSSIANTIGMIPVAGFMVGISYLVITLQLMSAQGSMPGGKLKRSIICSIPFSFIWLMAVLESVSSLGKPFWPEFLIGISDIVPVAMIGILVALVGFKGKSTEEGVAQRPTWTSIAVITAVYFVGRYLMYAVLDINSGYTAQPMATCLWTLAMGSSIGLAYYLLSAGLKGKTPFTRALWFSCMVFGLYWLINNFFMPIIFDISFVNLSPPILNYVYRVIGDVLFVLFGVWIADKSSNSKPVTIGE